jgi:REP element-mobilizing transposase RayT
MAPATPQSPRGWHSRGYLPHFDAGDVAPQSVTFRLHDSIPVELLNRWCGELRQLDDVRREIELKTRIERGLDAGYGRCHLRDPKVADLVEQSLLFFDGERYRLHAWVVMPNHVHTLFTPLAGWSLSVVVGGWKSFTSKQANKLLARSGAFWQEDYFDRYIRTDSHYADVTAYIDNNPVKAGLCNLPEDWRFGSARRRA